MASDMTPEESALAKKLSLAAYGIELPDFDFPYRAPNKTFCYVDDCPVNGVITKTSKTLIEHKCADTESVLKDLLAYNNCLIDANQTPIALKVHYNASKKTYRIFTLSAKNNKKSNKSLRN